MSIENKIAIILNENAKNVDQSLINHCSQYHKDDVDIFPEEKDDIATTHRKIMERRYQFCAPLGGDGTVDTTINQLLKEGKEKKLPKLIIGKWGTGNALSSYVGAKSSPNQLEDLIRNRDPQTLPTITIPLIEISINNEETHYSFIAGSGWDAAILNKYETFKNENSSSWKKIFSQGLPGYLIAGMKTAIDEYRRPRDFSGVTVTVNEGPAYQLRKYDRFDVQKKNIQRGDLLLYQPKVHIVGVGTAPFFGFNFRGQPLAPFGTIAENGLMQLRLVHGPKQAVVAKTLATAPLHWMGMRSRNILEYFVQDITVEYDHPVAFQWAGDAAGQGNKVRYKISDKKINAIYWKDIDQL